MIYVFASINGILAVALGVYGFWSDYTEKIKAASKHDCIGEIIKLVEKTNRVKSECDKLNSVPQYRERWGGYYNWQNGG